MTFRDDIALHGFAKRFLDASNEEREHAVKLIQYQNMRGGRVVFRYIMANSISISKSMNSDEQAKVMLLVL